MGSGSQRVVVIRREDIVRNILVRALRSVGFEVRVYPPKTPPWQLSAEELLGAVLHVPAGEEAAAASLVEALRGRARLYLHAEDPGALALGEAEVLPVLAPLSLILEKLLALAGRARPQGAALR